ncbi:MAG: histidinol-phosphate transaminase [Desulfopila sp.]|jgi:histidinol-phosphate aminotransferase|nr:histidinol-phosphate transaminase [Desulfopila sp.]
MNILPPSGPQSLIKESVAALPRYQTGLPENIVKKRYKLERIARLASNENPFGTGKLAKQAAAETVAEIWKYSDPHSSALKLELSRLTGVDQTRIVTANGSEELLSLLCRACLNLGERVVTVHPSFPLHEINPLEQGAVVTAVAMTENIQFDVKNLAKEAGRGCKILIFSNPSNPTGSTLDTSQLSAICAAVQPGTLVIVDEAYYEYAKDSPDYADSLAVLSHSGLCHVVLRTFSKAYGLAGGRVGYGLFSHAWLAEKIDTLRTPFNVNSFAQSAAAAALRDTDHLEMTVAYNVRERERVSEELRRRGFQVADSAANFVFLDAGRDSRTVAEELLQQGVIVKPWTASGYETFLRVTIGSQDDNNLFLNALRHPME